MEVRPLVDSEDILAEVFTEGPGEDPKYLLMPDGPLTAGPEPHEVRLAEATCTEGCCGALYVTIRRDGDHVIWSEWRNHDEDNVDLPEFWFDAREYQTEVERAVADHSWEWPARTVARLLELDLRKRVAGLHDGNVNSAVCPPGFGSPTRSTSSSSIRAARPSGKTAHGCSSGWCSTSPVTTLKVRPRDLLSNSWRVTHVRQPRSVADHRSTPSSLVIHGRSGRGPEREEHRLPVGTVQGWNTASSPVAWLG